MLALWEAGAPLMCQTVTAQKCSRYIFPVTLPGVSDNLPPALHCTGLSFEISLQRPEALLIEAQRLKAQQL